MCSWIHPRLVCEFYASVRSGVRCWGGEFVPFLQFSMMFMTDETSWGAYLLRCHHCAMIACILSQMLSAFLHCRMWGKSYFRVPHPRGNSANGQFPLRFIVNPMGSSYSVVLVVHLFRKLGATMASTLSASQSTKFQFFMLRVCTLCHRSRIRGPIMASSSYSFIFVEFLSL